MPTSILSTILVSALICFSTAATAQNTSQGPVDASFDAIRAAVRSVGLQEVVAIDHARLAAAEGVEMPPSRVQLFSDAAIESQLLKAEIRAGLDLPFRVLSYAERDQNRVAYTDARFLSIRHGLSSGKLEEAFDATLSTVFNAAAVEGSRAPTENIGLDFGITELTSEYDFMTTIARLEKAVMAQGDTVWFGEIDFSARARAQGVELPRATLLLFGGPAPGGVAMAQFPAIGLDAFCQKLLVYIDTDNSVKVVYNDIAALAELHYGRSSQAHHALNQRLTETFTEAINTVAADENSARGLDAQNGKPGDPVSGPQVIRGGME